MAALGTLLCSAGRCWAAGFCIHEGAAALRPLAVAGGWGKAPLAAWQGYGRSPGAHVAGLAAVGPPAPVQQLQDLKLQAHRLQAWREKGGGQGRGSWVRMCVEGWDCRSAIRLGG